MIFSVPKANRSQVAASALQFLIVHQIFHRTAILSMLLVGFNLQTISAQTNASLATSEVVFDDYFLDKALRLEMFQCGDAREMSMTLGEMFEEPVWPENPRHLLMPFAYGRFRLRLLDDASGRLLFSKGFDTMYAEYATTEPALQGKKRVFETAVRCPFPKAKVRLDIEARDKQNNWSSIFSTTIDPSDFHIRRESVELGDWSFTLQSPAHPHDSVDIVFLADGYTADQRDKFKSDVERMSEFLLSSEPYKAAKNKFNVRGVFRASNEQGTDEPRQGSFKSTVLDATFNIFDLDRYLLLERNHVMHRMAAQVPYDTIVVLVNTRRYGGGSICLDYCTCTTDDPLSKLVFVHEFGHSFAYLADEYVGSVSYNDLYPQGVEPVEANITRELDREKIKWKAFLSPDVELPTPKSAKTSNLVGAFEGGGYVAKGMYRPQAVCWMGSPSPKAGMCVVCRQALAQMIDFYTQ